MENVYGKTVPRSVSRRWPEFVSIIYWLNFLSISIEILKISTTKQMQDGLLVRVSGCDNGVLGSIPV